MSEEVIGKEGKILYDEKDGIHDYVVHLTTAMEDEELAAKPGIKGHEQRRKASLYYLIRDHYKNTAAKAEYRISQDINPMQDQYGLIRVGTRLDKSELPNDTKYPIVLIKDHTLTELIGRDIHNRNKHIGTEHLLAECRKQYWIPQGRQLARKIGNSCIQCRKLRGRPFKYPDIPPLPETRVRKSKPFRNIGLDYFGPIYYKGNRTAQKCWVLICTCLATRNVHLEVVSNNGTLEFILAMRRFIARRGTPKTVILDNAKTFILGEKIFNGDIRRMAEESDTFTTFLDQHPMEWKFITPLSPWKGGIYERIIGIVKKLLYASGDTEQFNFTNQLQRIIIGWTVMRPADFISPEVKLGIHHDDGTWDLADLSITEGTTREHMRQLNKHMFELWSKWEKMYLTQLKQAKKKMKHYAITTPDRFGQTIDGKKEFLKSVNQLIPLEIEPKNTKVAEKEPTTSPSNTDTEPPTTEPDTEKNIVSMDNGGNRRRRNNNPASFTDITRDANPKDLRTRSFLPRRAKEGVVYCDLASEYSQNTTTAKDQVTHYDGNKRIKEECTAEEHHRRYPSNLKKNGRSQW
uniref:Integrase catalytic domain-containing protein n=1 Tax=Caenorhabditis japonica TaxID=281687 RepID=A0A8R1E9W2_CAEJA